MSELKPDAENAEEPSLLDPKGLHSRRAFLKQVGLGSAALAAVWVVPQFTTVGARRAYAAVTGTPTTPCDACEELGRPRDLVIKYTGTSASNHTQDAGKVSEIGSIPAGSPVRIRVTNKSNAGDISPKLYFDGLVAVGGSFTASSILGSLSDHELSSTVYLYVYPDNSTPLASPAYSVMFHASCSQPLSLGDQFGAFLITGWANKDGVTDAKCGNSICKKGFKINSLVVKYTGDNVLNHSQDSGKVEVTGDPADATPVWIVATNQKVGGSPGDRTWFSGPVALNANFEIKASNAGEDKFDSETTFIIKASENGSVLQTATFHTSCSQPLFKDDEFGSIKLVSSGLFAK